MRHFDRLAWEPYKPMDSQRDSQEWSGSQRKAKPCHYLLPHCPSHLEPALQKQSTPNQHRQGIE